MRVSAQRQRPPSRERRHHRLQVTLPPPYPTRGGSRATVVGSRRERARHRGPQTRTRQGGGQTRDTGAPKPGHGGAEGKPETQGPPNQDTAGWRENPRHRGPQTRTRLGGGQTRDSGAPKPGHSRVEGKPETQGPPNQDMGGDTGGPQTRTAGGRGQTSDITAIADSKHGSPPARTAGLSPYDPTHHVQISTKITRQEKISLNVID